MSANIHETDILGHPELEAEAAEGDETQNSDARPVSSQPYDWTISTLREKYERGQVDLQPHYQREYVWELKPELPSRLIESLLLEIPVAPIYFGKMPGGRLEVFDGQQRESSRLCPEPIEFSLCVLMPERTRATARYVGQLSTLAKTLLT
jgi:hypothetical protein